MSKKAVSVSIISISLIAFSIIAVMNNSSWMDTFLHKIYPINIQPSNLQQIKPIKPTNKTSLTPQIITTAPLPAASVATKPESILKVERLVVELVNQERSKSGLSPVTWDETAAKAARKHVQEEADFGYISHWGMDGSKPQLRYSRVGGLDAVDENESVTLWPQGGFQGISQTELLKIVTDLEASMIDEQPPNNGHSLNILDSHHTGVGIAIAIGKYGVAMAQEFTNHYAIINPVPLTASPGSIISLSGRIIPGYKITGIYALWEPSPQPMSKDQLNQTHSYSDPPWDDLHFFARPNGEQYYVTTNSGRILGKDIEADALGNFAINIPMLNRHTLDYLTLELAPNNNSEDKFFAGQFVIEH